MQTPTRIFKIACIFDIRLNNRSAIVFILFTLLTFAGVTYQTSSARAISTGSDLLFLHARYYDPELGRFLTPDPLTSAANIGINRYAYSGSSPSTNIDPEGMLSRSVGKRLNYAFKLINKMLFNTSKAEDMLFVNQQGVKQLLGRRDITAEDRILLIKLNDACDAFCDNFIAGQASWDKLRQLGRDIEINRRNMGAHDYKKWHTDAAERFIDLQIDIGIHKDILKEDVAHVADTWNDVRTKSSPATRKAFNNMHTKYQRETGRGLHEEPPTLNTTGPSTNSTLAIPLAPGAGTNVDWNAVGQSAAGAAKDFVEDAVWDLFPGSWLLDIAGLSGFKLPNPGFNIPNVYPTNGRPWDVPGCFPQPHVPC